VTSLTPILAIDARLNYVESTPVLNAIDSELFGHEMHALIAELYPICRSITGKGVRETLNRLQRFVPLTMQEVPTGTRVFDWTVPPEWNIRDAYVKNSRGERVIDFYKSNLHVVSYSVPVHDKMSLQELRPHLFSLPEHPEWIPYRTSYYKRDWGFCLSHNQFLELPEDQYEVYIDASLENGYLTFGELYLPGEEHKEILISTHICHPSLANDNLSGIVVSCFLAKHISQLSRKYSYRFVFVPGTIGAITWLCVNESRLPWIKHGLVLTGLGDQGPLSYKRSRRGDTETDRACVYALREFGATILDFSPYGYDERQYCSPGFNLAVGRLSRTPHGTFPEYHTSADNLNFVDPIALSESFAACLSIFSILERNRRYMNTNPRCEPQLGERGLYRAIGGSSGDDTKEMAMLWVLNLSDGRHSLLDIAERSRINFDSIHHAAVMLEGNGLLKASLNRSRPNEI
jgi:aminopeptidase-like protein